MIRDPGSGLFASLHLLVRVLLLGPVTLCRKVFHLTGRLALRALPRIFVETRDPVRVSLDFVYALSGRSPPASLPTLI